MPRRSVRLFVLWLALVAILVPAGLLTTRAQDPNRPPPVQGNTISNGTPLAPYFYSHSFDVGPYNLFLDCVGAGGPAIILETGFSEPGAAMDILQNELGRTNLTCTYDRAGLGRSGIAPEPRVAGAVVADLHTLLTLAGVPAPYVLAGHSAGGSFVQLYARTYPDQVLGVVAMNPVPPADRWLPQALPLMDAWEQSEEQAAYRGEGQSESIDWNTSGNQLLAAPAPPPGMPFEMLISSNSQCRAPGDACNRTWEVYRAIQEEVTAQWPRGTMTVLPVGVDIHVNAIPDVIGAIQRVIGPNATPVVVAPVVPVASPPPGTPATPES
jgi:pimeloyl-ACP methyl ester carboxylesterase